jgi:hypothetical protein
MTPLNTAFDEAIASKPMLKKSTVSRKLEHQHQQ